MAASAGEAARDTRQQALPLNPADGAVGVNGRVHRVQLLDALLPTHGTRFGRHVEPAQSHAAGAGRRAAHFLSSARAVLRGSRCRQLSLRLSKARDALPATAADSSLAAECFPLGRREVNTHIHVGSLQSGNARCASLRWRTSTHVSFPRGIRAVRHMPAERAE